MLECPGLIGVYFWGLFCGVILAAAVDWGLDKLRGKVRGMGVSVEDWKEMGESFKGDD